ncbi:MAG: DUF6931 family protein [Pararhodobacter sp.]
MTGQQAETSTTLRYQTAADLFAALPEIGEDIESRPEGHEDSPGFARRLLSGPVPEEAVTFAAQMFNRRVAVWWGHECLRHLGPCLDATDRAMMQRAADWVTNPSEAPRAEALSAAMQAEARTPGVWLALATGWSGGSIAPAGTSMVPPPRFLTGRGVNAAILSALARVPQRQRQDRLADFLSMAEDLV